MATLHHQPIYRIQDHAIDLPLLGQSEDTILITAEREDDIPTILQISRQIPREELKLLIRLEWITSSEQLHQQPTPIHLLDPKFQKLPNGNVKTVFNPKDVASSSTPPVFQSLMIKPVTFEKDIPLNSIAADGSPIYTEKVEGNFIWDVDPSMCDTDCACHSPQSNGTKATCRPPTIHKRPDDPNSPWIGIRKPSTKPKPLWIYDRALEILKEEDLIPPDLQKNPF
ncbi:uncharacterized protein LOC131148259 [Malania oleifera]|uniref:uncharacterized protein LOC131148259 n=1 Tax=Malania oleifera TaxID=397392 RepID=UPI0025AE4FED|nr:uncharacterized protein LOC131148259 [Malania oleifera]